MMTKISDVARGAGVSTSTVSNFLNGRCDRMRPETQQRIEKAIAELRYRPNTAARQLKTGRAPFIGLLVPSMANPMYAVIAREIEIFAQERYGRRVMMGNTHRDAAKETSFIEDLHAHGVHGLIVISSSADESHLEAAARRGMAIVSYDRRATNASASALDHMSVDNYQSAVLATRCLIESGHRKLGFVTPAARTMSRDEKVTGFLDAAKEAGLHRSAKVFFCGPPREFGDSMLSELGRTQGREFGNATNRPTGLVAVNDLMALGLLAGCRDAGLSVPKAMSLVGMDNVFFSELMQPALTTVNFPVREIAARMVERVMVRQEDEKVATADFTFAPTLLRRDSVVRPE